MKLTRHPALTPHRLARLTAWMRLWLQALAGWVLILLPVDRARLKRWLCWTSRRMGMLVFLHVALRVRPPQHKSWRRAPAHRARLSTLVGSRLRRALRRRDPVAHFFAILDVMRDLETHIRRLARRLANGLTRSPRPPKREHRVLALPPGAAALIGADSS